MTAKLILLHGALGNCSQLVHVEAKLSELLPVKCITFKGHHHNKEEYFDVEILRDQLLEDLQEGPAFIFGFSMGGYVALKAAAKRSDNIKGIITLGTKFNWSEESTESEIQMLIPEIVESKVPQFADLLAQRFGEHVWMDQMRQTAGMMTKLSKGQQLSAKEFEAINVPVHILRGTDDKMVSKEESIAASQKIKTAQFSELQDVQHPVEKLSPELLVPFLNQLTQIPA